MPITQHHSQDDSSQQSTTSRWPDPLPKEAYHGLAGEFVRIVSPHTEADPAALLFSYFVTFGSLIGRGAHFVAEADKHFTNLFMTQVGMTSKGRKGSSLGQVKRVFRRIDETWSGERVQSGLSSGEGLIWAVRDAVEREEPVKENKQVVDYQKVIQDPGVSDKRLLVVEGEFASTLKVMGREGNTLSAVIRNAWDTGDLRVLAKTCPASATGAHISIIGHITREELLKRLDSTEAGNGFGNRFLWVCVKRSKMLPEGGRLVDDELASHIRRLDAAVCFARGVGEMERDEEARRHWHAVYAELSEGKPGMLGAMTARAEAQVMRLACISALLDCSSIVRMPHLTAALAMWRYAEDSARFIFGESVGDSLADQLLEMLQTEPDGLTRWEVTNRLGRNKSAHEIRKSLNVLLEHGLARREQEESGGRPTERWHAVLSSVAMFRDFGPAVAHGRPDSPNPETPDEENEVNEESPAPPPVSSSTSYTSFDPYSDPLPDPHSISHPSWDCPECGNAVFLRYNERGETYSYKCNRCNRTGRFAKKDYLELRDAALRLV